MAISKADEMKYNNNQLTTSRVTLQQNAMARSKKQYTCPCGGGILV